MIERFFDESGGMQLVIHAPFGSRINRAWGLALRKRFCRTLQLRAAGRGDRGRDRAVAVDQRTASRSTRSRATCIRPRARDVLIQALLDAPMFGVRWRWNATTALALPRFARRHARSRRSCSA